MNNLREAVRTETDAALRTRALESLLIEKGLLTTDIIDEVVQKYEKDVGPLNGAKVVARAWSDPDYKRRLLEDGTAAIAELGFGDAQGCQNRRTGKRIKRPPRRRLHPLFLLSLVRTRPAAEVGTSPTPIALGRCGSRERSCGNLTSIYPIRSKSASGTATRISATWCCPNALPARKTIPKNNSFRLSRATR